MREIDEFPDEETRIEDRRSKVKENEEHPLSAEERDEIIRTYNAEHSIELKDSKSGFAKISTPQYNGIEIVSIDQFKNILSQEYKGLADREDISKLLRALEFHIDISQLYKTGDNIPRGVHSKLERKYDIPHKVVRKVLFEGEQSSIFSYLKKAISSSEGYKLRSRIINRLEGINSFQELDRRFRSYYLHDSLLIHKQYRKHRENAKDFFRLLDFLPIGGFCTDIARIANLEKLDVQRWILQEKIPRHVEIGTLIPSKSPEDNHKWLPLRMQNDHKLEHFIEVPIEIESPNTILKLMKNLPVLETKSMKRYEQKFGAMPKHLALMYFLGSQVSDGTFGLSYGGNSTYTQLVASKDYQWSDAFGNGFCYCANRLGIGATRVSDNKKKLDNGEIIHYSVWRTDSSPFLLWMKQELLGLKSKTPKSQTSIQAEWILKMPYDWRIKFLQGLADGDGWASTRGLDTGISTAVNQEFFERIFHSVGIESKKTPSSVLITRKEEIRNAKQLPLFYHSTGRQGRLDTLVAMSDSVTGKWISGREKEIVLDLHERGLSGGEISEVLWKNYGIARNPSTLNYFTKRHDCGE